MTDYGKGCREFFSNKHARRTSQRCDREHDVDAWMRQTGDAQLYYSSPPANSCITSWSRLNSLVVSHISQALKWCAATLQFFSSLHFRPLLTQLSDNNDARKY